MDFVYIQYRMRTADGREILSRLRFDPKTFDLVEEVWGYGSEATSNVVDSLVAGLRRKLGERASAIETVRGTGYRLRK